MNYIKHLTGFFEKVATDKSLNPTHVSLYMALFQFWNCNRFKNPISISRDEVMRISKISSKATYHKCLKNLHASSYLNYEPSYNPFRGSHVYMFNFADELKPMSKNEKLTTLKFELVGKQVADKLQSATETSGEQAIEQAVVPSINNTNITNNQNIEKGLNADQPTIQNKKTNLDIDEDTDAEKEKKLRQKKKEFESGNPEEEQPSSPPNQKEVTNYFLQQNASEIEANKFYNYNNSIGWIIGGKSPIINWKSAALNWILKIPNFTHQNNASDQNRSTILNTSPEKDYAEPL